VELLAQETVMFMSWEIFEDSKNVEEIFHTYKGDGRITIDHARLTKPNGRELHSRLNPVNIGYDGKVGFYVGRVQIVDDR
jgi:hypothetical protein